MIGAYHEQIYINRLDSLDEMDKCLETQKLPRVNLKDTENPNRPVPSNEIGSVSRNLPAEDECCQASKGELIPGLLRLFQRSEEEGTLPNSFYVAALPRYQSQTMTLQENNRPISLMNSDAKVLNRILASRIQHVARIHTPMTKCSLFLECKDGSAQEKWIAVVCLITGWRKTQASI